MTLRILAIATALLFGSAWCNGANAASWTQSTTTPTGMGGGMHTACDPDAGTDGVIVAMREAQSITQTFIWSYDIGADTLVNRINLNAWSGCAYPNPRKYTDIDIIDSDVIVSGWGCSTPRWYTVSTPSPMTSTSPTWSGGGSPTAGGNRNYTDAIEYTIGSDNYIAIGAQGGGLSWRGRAGILDTTTTNVQSFSPASMAEGECHQDVVNSEFVGWGCGKTNDQIAYGSYHEDAGAWTQLHQTTNYTGHGLPVSTVMEDYVAWPSQSIGCGLWRSGNDTAIICHNSVGTRIVEQVTSSAANSDMRRSLSLGSDDIMRVVENDGTILECETPSASCFVDDGEPIGNTGNVTSLEECNNYLVALTTTQEIWIADLSSSGGDPPHASTLHPSLIPTLEPSL